MNNPYNSYSTVLLAITKLTDLLRSPDPPSSLKTKSKDDALTNAQLATALERLKAHVRGSSIYTEACRVQPAAKRHLAGSMVI